MKKYLLFFFGFLTVQLSYSQTYTFTGNGFWSNASNWVNSIIPPAVLPAGSTIYISTTPGNSCILNVAQTISPGASIIISSGANFIISGGINIINSVPIITTNALTQIAPNGYNTGGNVIDDGGSAVTERGVVWGRNPDPTIAGNKLRDLYWGSGTFTQILNGLSFGNTYYLRAYATNSSGTAYGNEITFTTGQQPASTIICTQEWTSSNLDLVTYRNGDTIPQITSKAQWDTLTTGGWCYYEFWPNNYYGYAGRFYNYYALTDPRGLAPAGWHIPCDSEWAIITNCLGGEEIAGAAMKDTARIYWNPSNASSANSSGFTALGSGRYLAYASCQNYCGWDYTTWRFQSPLSGLVPVSTPSYKNYAFWWSSTEQAATTAGKRYVYADYPNLFKDTFNAYKNNALSVRCVKGDVNLVCSTTLPVVTTDSIVSFGPNYAFGGGIVPNNNIRFVTERGLVWDTLPNPTIANYKDTAGSGMGNFAVKLTNLLANKTYYVRAYAINNFGIAYGNQRLVTTLPAIAPGVSTWFISNTNTTAVAGGKIIDDGGGPVIVKGVVWNTNPNPTIANHFTTEGSGASTYSSNIPALSANTLYYVRAYATNIAGTAYGNEVLITTGNPSPASVIICDKIWTQKNLDVTTYRNGDPIPQVTDSAAWNSLTTGAWCWYNNDSATYASTYGRMYNWYAATDPRGIAPAGYHVPSNLEWISMLSCLGTSNINGPASNALRESGTTHWNSPNAGATNSSGFTALPGGRRWEQFGSLGTGVNFWCSDAFDYNGLPGAVANNVEIDMPYVFLFGTNKKGGHYVRCIRDSVTNANINNSLPVLTTATVSAITSTTAACGGNIINNGGSPVTARGVVWNTVPMPPSLTSTNKTVDGNGTGLFTSTLTGLAPGVIYYVWAYATNVSGTAYGSQMSFTTTVPVVPGVTTSALTSLSSTSLRSGGIISANYAGPAITARGVVWGTSSNPTILNNKTIDGSGTGNFTSLLNGLLSNTTYYVRAYATNSSGTYYGNQETLDPANPTTNICGKLWTQKNLDVSTYRNGDPIPQVTDQDTWSQLTTGAWCWYNNDSATYAATYGKMYNWFAVNDPRGLAPQGWHVANDAEWAALSGCFGGDAVAGGDLKEAGTTHWLSPNTSATNNSAFTGLPGGYRISVGVGGFSDILSRGFWWTTGGSLNTGNIRVLTNTNTILSPYSNWKSYGCSVRCVRD